MSERAQHAREMRRSRRESECTGETLREPTCAGAERALHTVAHVRTRGRAVARQYSHMRASVRKQGASRMPAETQTRKNKPHNKATYAGCLRRRRAISTAFLKQAHTCTSIIYAIEAVEVANNRFFLAILARCTVKASAVGHFVASSGAQQQASKHNKSQYHCLSLTCL